MNPVRQNYHEMISDIRKQVLQQWPGCFQFKQEISTNNATAHAVRLKLFRLKGQKARRSCFSFTFSLIQPVIGGLFGYYYIMNVTFPETCLCYAYEPRLFPEFFQRPAPDISHTGLEPAR